MHYLTDTSHPETRVAGGPSRVQVAEVVAVNVDDGTIDASLLNGRATKVHVPYPSWWVPQVGERCLLADRDGDARQPICLGFLSPADGSNAGPTIQGTVSLAKASATVLGVTKLSTAPADAANPIAVGDNDPRNTNARTPTGAAGGVLAGTYPNPSFAVDMATQTELDAVAASALLDGDAAGGDLSGTYPNPSVVKATDAAYGKTRLSVAAASAADPIAVGDNDARMTNARTPTAHAASHAAAGTDPVAIAESQVTGLTADLAAKAPLASPTFTGDVRYDPTSTGTKIAFGSTQDALLFRAASTGGSVSTGMLKIESTVAGDAGAAVQNKSSTGFSGHVFVSHDAGVAAFFGLASSGVAGGPYMRVNSGNSPLRLFQNGTLRIEADATGIGVFGVTPAARAAAYTQTYATASRTHSNPTAAAVATTAATSTTPFGYTTAAQANAIVAAINALITDVANVKQVLNSVIDDNQAYGWLQ